MPKRHPTPYQLPLSPFLVGLLTGIALVLMVQLVAGEPTDPAQAAPEFPFKSINQLEGLPGLTADLPHQSGACLGHEGVRARFRDAAGEILWQVFVQVDGPAVTGAFYGYQPHPQFIYHGTYNPENGRITIQTVEPYNSVRHVIPCSTWGVPS